MSRIVIIGSGMAAHGAALQLSRSLRSPQDSVIVISVQDRWEFTPAGTLIACGKMRAEDLSVPLGPLYRRQGIIFHQAQAQVIYPQGTKEDARPQVEIEFVDKNRLGQVGRLPYDYLILATGLKPKLFATPGLSDTKRSVFLLKSFESCTQAGKEFKDFISQVKNGASKRIVVGAAHRLAAATGPCLEHCLELDRVLNEQGIRDQVDMVYFTGEQVIGELEAREMLADQDGVTTSISRLFTEHSIRVINRAAVEEICENFLYYRTPDGKQNRLDFDHAVLVAPMEPRVIKILGPQGENLQELVFDQNGYATTRKILQLRPVCEEENLPENLQNGTKKPVKNKMDQEILKEEFFDQFTNPNFDNIFVIGAMQPTPDLRIETWFSEETDPNRAQTFYNDNDLAENQEKEQETSINEELNPENTENARASDKEDNGGTLLDSATLLETAEIKQQMPWYVAKLSGQAVAARILEILKDKDPSGYIFDPARVSPPYNPFATGRRAWLTRALTRWKAMYQARALPLWWLIR